MKVKRIPLERFDLEGFYNWAIKFIRAEITGSGEPTFAIAYAEEADGDLGFGELEGADVVDMLLTGTGIFFFPYRVDEDKLYFPVTVGPCCGFDPEEVVLFKSPMGSEKTLGFLINRDGNDLVVRSAFWELCRDRGSSHSAPFKWTRFDECNEAMTTLIERFIKN